MNPSQILSVVKKKKYFLPSDVFSVLKQYNMVVHVVIYASDLCLLAFKSIGSEWP